MSANCNKYTQPHTVVVMLHRKRTTTGEDIANGVATRHHHYYQSLQCSGKVISYGHAMNIPGLCIILSVQSDEDFKNIIDNDPGIVSGCFEVGSVVPFIVSEIAQLTAANRPAKLDHL